jgi:5-methylcytosine-specific restriction endonuclease McrA
MERFYSTSYWKEIRKTVIDKRGEVCQRCGGNDRILVHHILPRNDGGGDEEENLKVVCKHCHIKEHIDACRKSHPKLIYNPTKEELVSMGVEYG